jgi:predicted negative regulator of RcsB-dependent stress response
MNKLLLISLTFVLVNISQGITIGEFQKKSELANARSSTLNASKCYSYGSKKKEKKVTASQPYRRLKDNIQPSSLYMGTLLSGMMIPFTEDEIPAVLRDRVQQSVYFTNEMPEMGFTMAAALCTRWSSTKQTEYIFTQILDACEKISKGRGVEITVAMFRPFVGQLKDKELQRRAQLKIGRLYYDRGQYGKAVIELQVDIENKTPSQYDSLSGLIKGVALIRLRKLDQAFPLLEWVVANSQDIKQKAKSALLLGRINMLRNSSGEARKWLKKVAYEIPDEACAKEAKELLIQIKE